MAETASIRSADLMCCWSAWRVIAPGRLALDMPGNNCCDMDGVTRTGMILDPGVYRIDTFAGGEPDTYYIYGEHGWKAFEPPRREAR